MQRIELSPGSLAKGMMFSSATNLYSCGDIDLTKQ